jgi:predicted lactoylglutathione lyase
MISKIFVNLPVKDLAKSIDFFTKMGFTFNPQFTDENATCMIVGENIFAMLLVEKFFKSFTKKQICNTATDTEVIIALSAGNKDEVDQMMTRALAAGGSEPTAPQNHGWMYGRNFQDIDGHLWEVFWMDESMAKKE